MKLPTIRATRPQPPGSPQTHTFTRSCADNPVPSAVPGLASAFRRALTFLAIALGLFAAEISAQTITTRTLDLGSGPNGQTGQYTSQAIVNGNPAIAYYNAAESSLMFARNSAVDGSGSWSITTLDFVGIVGLYTSLAVVNGNPAISYYDASTGDLKYVGATDASGTTWGTPVTLDSTGNVGFYTSLAVVNGNPAISYYDNTNFDLKYVRATDASGTSWGTPVTVDSTGDVGLSTSLAVVNGNPAISYYDATNGDLRYVRATDASGTNWGTLVAVDSTGDVGQYPSLAVVNGNPAISYYDQTNRDLKYVRATDASGTTTWGTPVILDSIGDVGLSTSLAVVNGNPAISYYDQTNGDLKYVRATDASGTNWGTRVTLDSTGTVGQYTSLAVVNGNPAISYYDQTNRDLKTVRANDASGTTWAAATTVDAGVQSGVVGSYTSQAVVNGNPAISYYDQTNFDLKYVRATDASGTSWGTPVTLDSTGTVGAYTSLAVVNGNPAISYYDQSNGDLKYVRATDASGTNWGTPVTLDNAGDVGGFTSQAIVNGNPAISYYDATNLDLKYVRATDASGTSWGTPVTLDSTGTVGAYTSLAVVNGNPAISYYDQSNGDLKTVRATDASGTSWGTPVTVDNTGTVGLFTSLAVVNGNPAISYYDLTNGDLKTVRATDASGTSWGTPVTLDSTGTVGQYTSLVVVDDNPAISYYDVTNGNLKWATIVPAATAPLVTSPTSADILATTATLGGNVTSGGGSAITERGVVYSLTSVDADPNIGDASVTKVTASGTTGVFTAPVTGLTASSGYSFKAYATNGIGTTYTSVATFTTLAPPNAAPTDITLSNATIAENNAPGAPVGTLTATDADAGDTHTFTFATGGADNAAFTITGNTLSINAAADFETKSSYAIRIRATDSGTGNLTFEKQFTIAITDVNEATGPSVIFATNDAVAASSAHYAMGGRLPGAGAGDIGVANLKLPNGKIVKALANSSGIIIKVGDSLAAAGGAEIAKLDSMSFGVFLAELKVGTGAPAVTSATSKVVCFENGSGVQVLARSGAAAPGGSTFKSFRAACGDSVGNVFIAAILNDATTVDSGLWAIPAGGAMKLLVKEGQSINLGNGSKRINAVSAFPAGVKSQAEGRVHYGSDSIITRLTLGADHAIVTIPANATGSGDWTVLAMSGTDAPGALGKYDTLGLPAAEGTNVAFSAKLKTAGTVTTANNAIVVAGGTVIARKGDAAPGTGGIFVSFEDVAAGSTGQASFTAKFTIPAPAPFTGLWEYRDSTLSAVALQHEPAPDLSGVYIASITRFAHPGGGLGPVFVATLGGASASTNVGLFGVPATGGSALNLARTGDLFDINGTMRKLTTISALKMDLGNEGVARGYTDTSVFMIGSFGATRTALIEFPVAP